MDPGSRTICRSLVALALLAGAACAPSDAEPRDGSLLVVASFYPLADAARRVGGSCVDVVDLTPPGVEPHDLELSPDALSAIVTADVVVYVGGGFQPAVEEAVDEAVGTVVDISEGQSTLPSADGAAIDPHLWLDPSRYADIADGIATGLRAAGAPEGCGLDANAGAFRDELALLDAEFATGLDGCEADLIVTSHAAFAYLVDAYGLRQEAIAGVDPEAGIGARRMDEIRALLIREAVSTVFTEELVAPDVAETLASEVGARTAVLRTVEAKPETGDYASAMRENLHALRGALGCH